MKIRPSQRDVNFVVSQLTGYHVEFEKAIGGFWIGIPPEFFLHVGPNEHMGLDTWQVQECPVDLRATTEHFVKLESAVESIRLSMAEAHCSDDECSSCRGYGYFDANGVATIDRRGRKCGDCRGTGRA